jgi:hypothetical protein
MCWFHLDNPLSSASFAWFPIPIWIVVACIAFFVMLPQTRPSSVRRAAASMLVLWTIWLALFIAIMTAIGTTSTVLDVGRSFGSSRNEKALGLTAWLMMPAWMLIMILFLVFADLTFLSTHTYVNSIFDLRRLRGINLGFNIASLVIFPPLAVIGIPLTLVGMSRHRTKSPILYGWALACGCAAVIFVVVATLVIAITASVTSGVNTADGWMCEVVSTTPTITTTTTNGGTTTDTVPFEPTKCMAITYTWSRPLLTSNANAPAAVITFAMLFACANIVFVILTDTMILKLLPLPETSPTPGQVQLSSAFGQTLVHPCPQCSTPVQFQRTGPTTTVQCFSCSATVEFATN